MAEKEKINTILIIAGVSFTIIFLLLITILNLWIKLSVDKDRTVQMTASVGKDAESVKAITGEKKATILEREAAGKSSKIEAHRQEAESERELPVQADFLIN